MKNRGDLILKAGSELKLAKTEFVWYVSGQYIILVFISFQIKNKFTLKSANGEKVSKC